MKEILANFWDVVKRPVMLFMASGAGYNMITSESLSQFLEKSFRFGMGFACFWGLILFVIWFAKLTIIEY